MRLDASEIRTALDRAGIELPPLSLQDFIASLTCSRTYTSNPTSSGSGSSGNSSNNSGEKIYVTFPEFRDYLLLLPRKPSVNEVSTISDLCKLQGNAGPKAIDLFKAKLNLSLQPRS